MIIYLRIASSLAISYNQNNSYNRLRYSTDKVSLYIYEDFLSAVDQGVVWALLLLDLSAAFDIIGHAILIERLLHCGVTKPARVSLRGCIGFPGFSHI